MFKRAKAKECLELVYTNMYGTFGVHASVDPHFSSAFPLDVETRFLSKKTCFKTLRLFNCLDLVMCNRSDFEKSYLLESGNNSKRL